MDKTQDEGNRGRGDSAVLVVGKCLTTVVQESFVRCKKRMQLREETHMHLEKSRKHILKLTERNSLSPVTEPGSGSSVARFQYCRVCLFTWCSESSLHNLDSVYVDEVSDYWHSPMEMTYRANMYIIAYINAKTLLRKTYLNAFIKATHHAIM